MNNKLIGLMLALVLVALAAVAGYKAWPILFPEVVARVSVDTGCDLRAGPCVAQLPSVGELSFAIEPRDIPLVAPLQLEVKVSGPIPRQVEVDFSGVEMYMGYNRVRLTAVGNGHYRGEGRIPLCLRDAMEWEASVLLTTDQGTIDVPFRFITVKPGHSVESE